MKRTFTRRVPSRLIISGILAALAVVACGNGETGPEATNESVPVTATTVFSGDSTTGDDSDPPTEPVASDQDPCTILTIDEINQIFPGNDAPVAAEGTGCLYEGLRIDLSPLTLEVIEAEEAPTGWEVIPIEIEGAEWAVVRIDTNETEYEKVLDVIAGGPNGTVHLIADFGVDVEMGSSTYQGLVDLLQIAVGRQ